MKLLYQEWVGQRWFQSTVIKKMMKERFSPSLPLAFCFSFVVHIKFSYSHRIAIISLLLVERKTKMIFYSLYEFVNTHTHACMKIMPTKLFNEIIIGWLTWKYRITLHIASPRNHVSVTSHMTVGGKHNIITSRSAIAKLTMKMLVTVRIDLFA